MKVTETSSNGDIKTVILDLPECKSDIVRVYAPSDEPLAFRIMKSGWSKPQQYHVLIEYGDHEQTDYELLDADQIQEKHGIDIANQTDHTGIIVTAKMILETPNDGDLGKTVRKQFFQSTL